ncbi:4Fe-4S dicluster domain-containing protein [Dysgonomonas sp. 521]|uniref:4Fe-4S binding protein n=1 Tax=Dysgonomonas sp. 521 TaxID=2302932 RepID=UPI0013D84BB7|nr:4Fe-4S binding protein [Dysgonomonas sp. 521]NDV94496.1 4Fe-4S dicluster domain-containing protein [Dysgonomonas sp. 521]
MLKKIRVITASIFFILLTLLFLDFTGTIHVWFGWLAKIQLVPAILAMNAVVLVVLVLLTLLFGRVYCSVLCPLGIFQDGISNISGKRKGKKNRFSYSPAKSVLRYAVLVLFIIAVAAGVSMVVSILDPYAAYGRIVSNFFAPLYRLGNNLLALIAERVDSYAFYSTEVWIKGWLTFGIAAISLIIVAVLAWRHGRTYCNTICPVGTFLGFLSKFSLFRLTFNEEKCTKCKACERGCKSSCIDIKSMNIDHSRCVTCFNCIERCKFGAMKYAPVKLGNKKVAEEEFVSIDKTVAEDNKEGFSRRNMLAILGTVAIANTIKAQQLHVDGGLAEIEDKKIPDRKTPVVPPGALSAKHMKSKCTACQLCVSVCPNNILRPSNKLATFMQPEMSFERGYCRPECVECSQVCPTSAINPITTADKTALAIGHAVWIKENCVVNRDEVQCNNCEYHCPTNAITMIARDPGFSDSLKIPVIDTTLCIGCGACEHLCPARPFSAIYVEGNVRHHTV